MLSSTWIDNGYLKRIEVGDLVTVSCFLHTIYRWTGGFLFSNERLNVRKTYTFKTTRSVLAGLAFNDYSPGHWGVVGR